MSDFKINMDTVTSNLTRRLPDIAIEQDVDGVPLLVVVEDGVLFVHRHTESEYREGLPMHSNVACIDVRMGHDLKLSKQRIDMGDSMVDVIGIESELGSMCIGVDGESIVKYPCSLEDWGEFTSADCARDESVLVDIAECETPGFIKGEVDRLKEYLDLDADQGIGECVETLRGRLSEGGNPSLSSSCDDQRINQSGIDYLHNATNRMEKALDMQVVQEQGMS